MTQVPIWFERKFEFSFRWSSILISQRGCGNSGSVGGDFCAGARGKCW